MKILTISTRNLNSNNRINIAYTASKNIRNSHTSYVTSYHNVQEDHRLNLVFPGTEIYGRNHGIFYRVILAYLNHGMLLVLKLLKWDRKMYYIHKDHNLDSHCK
jgi:hypothetical protein